MSKSIQLIALDDDEFDLKVLNMTLESGPFQIRTYQTAANLFKNLNELEFGQYLFLIDYKLEDKHWNGVTVTKKLRKQFPESVIVLLSSHISNQVILDGKAAGADNYISKLSRGRPDFIQFLSQLYHNTIQSRSKEAHTLNRHFSDIAGETMKAHVSKIPSIVESTNSTVLVTGEPGTGKSYFIAKFCSILKDMNVEFIEASGESITIGSIKNLKRQLDILSPSSWIVLRHLHLLDPKVQKKLSSVIARANKVRFLFSHSAEEKIVPSLKEKFGNLEIYFRPLRERFDEIPAFIEQVSKSLQGGPFYIDPAALEVLSKQLYQDNNISELISVLNFMTGFRIGKTLTVASLPPELAIHQHERPSRSTKCTIHCLNVPFNPNETDIEYYSDIMLSGLLRKLYEVDRLSDKPTTLGNLAARLCLSRQTLSTRINRLISKQLILKEERDLWYAQ